MRTRIWFAVVAVVVSGFWVSGCGSRIRPRGESPADRETMITGAEAPTATGPNLLTNGGLEEASSEDPLLPAGWRRHQATANTVGLVLLEESSKGALGVEIMPHPEGKLWQTLVQDLPLPAKATVYVVSFDGRVEGPGQGKVSLVLRKNGRDHEVLGYKAFGGTEFKRHSFAARVPDEGGEGLGVWLGQGNYKNTECTVYYDNVSVRRAE